MTINSPGLNPAEVGELPAVPLGDAINPATPFRRVMAVMAMSYAGAFIVSAVPTTLLLTTHLLAIAGPAAATAFSIVTGVAGLLALIAQPLTGRFSDRTKARFGKRRSWILTGGLASSLIVVGMMFTTQVWQVVVVWGLVTIFVNVQFAATGALLAEQVPAHRRGSMSGVLGSMAIVGPILGLGAVSLVPTMPWLQWVIVGGSGLILVIVAVSLLRDPQLPYAPAVNRLTLLELVKSYWLSPRKHPAFGWAWAVRFLVTCTGAALTYNALLLVNRFGYDKNTVGGPVLLLTLTYGVLLVIFSTVGGVISDKLQRQKPFVMLAGVIAAIALVMIGLAPTVGFLFISIAVLGVAAGVFLSVDLAMSVRMLPNPANIGKDIAVMALANTLPSSVVPFIAPAFLFFGGYTALYVGLAVFGIVGAILVTRLPELGREGDPRWALITNPKYADKIVVE
jgi:MFS family permease